jgi:hypothetical protein
MQDIDRDRQPAPFGSPTEEDSERPGRLRYEGEEAAPAEWEDEWVDLGGEG